VVGYRVGVLTCPWPILCFTCAYLALALHHMSQSFLPGHTTVSAQPDVLPAVLCTCEPTGLDMHTVKGASCSFASAITLCSGQSAQMNALNTGQRWTGIGGTVQDIACLTFRSKLAAVHVT